MLKKSFLTVLAVTVAALVFAPGVYATLFNFDDLDHGQIVGKYQDALFLGSWTAIENPSYHYPPQSGSFVVFVDGIASGWIILDNPTHEVSGWFTSLRTLRFKAYDIAMNQVGSESMPGNFGSSNRMIISTDLDVIKYVVVDGPRNYWTMDDFDHAGGPPSAVPEPTTLLLLGAGLLGLGGYTRARFGKKK